MVSKYKKASFLSRFLLLILDLSSEAATRGVPFRNTAIFTVIAILNLLYFYTFRSITMFLKVLNKVNFISYY